MGRRYVGRGRRVGRAWGILAVLALAAPLAGCGSYSKHDFIAGADAICASAVRQTRSVLPPSSRQPSALGAYLAELLPILRAELKQIRGLERPAGSAREGALLTSYLKALDQSVGDFENLAAAARAGDRRAISTAESALRASTVGSLAASYGLRSCGTPGATVA